MKNFSEKRKADPSLLGYRPWLWGQFSKDNTLKRRYEAESDIQMSITVSMIGSHQRWKNFKDILIQDSTIIRLHESLAKLWPAARSKKAAAGVNQICRGNSIDVVGKKLKPSD